MKLDSEELIYKLKKISVLLGKNKNYIQASGGNTSCKIKKKMYVKASGKYLRNALDENIFLSVDHNKIIRKFEREESYDNEIIDNIDSKLPASIETELHAIMPHKFVIHSHPVDVIAQSVQKGAKREIEKILKGFSWTWIEYTKPGNELAHKIYTKIKTKDIDILILENHGLVIGGENDHQVLKLHNQVVNLLTLKSRKFRINNLQILRDLVEILKEKGIKCRLPNNPIIHTLATDNWSFKIASENPLYPDHIVFCGKDSHLVKKVDFVKAPYINYNNSNYVIFENIGVIIFDRFSNAGEEMLEAQSKINLKLPACKEIHHLSDKQCNELKNWDAEIYRVELNKKRESEG